MSLISRSCASPHINHPSENWSGPISQLRHTLILILNLYIHIFALTSAICQMQVSISSVFIRFQPIPHIISMYTHPICWWRQTATPHSRSSCHRVWVSNNLCLWEKRGLCFTSTLKAASPTRYRLAALFNECKRREHTNDIFKEQNSPFSCLNMIRGFVNIVSFTAWAQIHQ